HLIVDLVWTRPGESFDEVLPGSTAAILSDRLLVPKGVRSEVRGVDNKRVTVPATASVAPPLPDGLVEVGPAVDGDDAPVVNHFVEDRDVTRRLKDLVRIVVAERHHDGWQTLRDAAIPQIEVTPGRDALAKALCLPIFGALLHRVSDRDSAVRRVDD